MNLQEYFETGLVMIGIILLVVFTWFIWSLSAKILGFLLILLGLFTLRYFPRMSKYQPVQFQRSGILISILFLVVGLLLLIF